MNPSHKKYSIPEFIQAYESALKNHYGSREPQQEVMHVSFNEAGAAQYEVKQSEIRETNEISVLLNELEQINRAHYLQVKIDRALEAGDKPLFMQLSDELNRLTERELAAF